MQQAYGSSDRSILKQSSSSQGFTNAAKFTNSVKKHQLKKTTKSPKHLILVKEASKQPFQSTERGFFRDLIPLTQQVTEKNSEVLKHFMRD